MALKLNNFSYEEIRIGDEFFFNRTIDSSAIDRFVELSGDRNPLHTDDGYAQTTQFAGCIAHGMLLASFFSALVGMSCPGKRSLYLSQSVIFKNPARIGDQVVVAAKVLDKSDATQVVTLKTTVKNTSGLILVDGEAKVKVL